MYRLTSTMIACLSPLLLTLSFSSAGLVAAVEQTGTHSSVLEQDQPFQQKRLHLTSGKNKKPALHSKEHHERVTEQAKKVVAARKPVETNEGMQSATKAISQGEHDWASLAQTAQGSFKSGQKLTSWGGKNGRQLGGKFKKAGKKEMGGMGKKGKKNGASLSPSPVACIGIDDCNDQCFEFFDALNQTVPVEFCGATCETCSCKCADETCFNDCTCESLEKAGFIEEALEFGCYEDCEDLENAGLFELALFYGCYPCSNPLYYDYCVGINSFFFDLIWNETIPEGLCQEEYCDCSYECAVEFEEGTEARAFCDLSCTCDQVDFEVNPNAATGCPNCANPEIKADQVDLCEFLDGIQASPDGFCEDSACDCIDRCVEESVVIFGTVVEEYFVSCYEECLCDSLDPDRTGVCVEVSCEVECVAALQEDFMLDESAATDICGNYCPCFEFSPAGDALAQTGCACETVKPSGPFPNEAIAEELQCECIEPLELIFTESDIYTSYSQGCFEDCQYACELVFGVAGFDVDLEGLCYDLDLFCECAAGCDDPTLSEEEFNTCAQKCYCQGAEYLVTFEGADSAILDALACEV
eukprot:CAMPEP_0172464388 /NCGR_PEP_ID=MMETSP1065-20121228/50291_1 /TAXON_ID=265537 /ORGANISM="Amphiprora paludosa, Strain CCMP125" /LENGTH=584 /DNA_ID=CAMNT_0013220599 /DNA_START=84 /DNA_END=1838 /DNA_ORIENTATION=-